MCYKDWLFTLPFKVFIEILEFKYQTTFKIKCVPCVSSLYQTPVQRLDKLFIQSTMNTLLVIIIQSADQILIAFSCDSAFASMCVKSSTGYFTKNSINHFDENTLLDLLRLTTHWEIFY